MSERAILVTGAAGLIGFTLAQRLAASGRPVIGMDRIAPAEDGGFECVEADLTDVHKLYATLERGCAGIIHCGAISGPMLLRDNPRAIVEFNVGGTANVLEAARVVGLGRVVYCSSTSAYGHTPPAIDRVSEDVALNAVDVYGATKAAGDVLARAYAAQHGLDTVALRFSWVYGPRRRTECLIRDLIQDAQAGRVSRYAFTPAFARQYVYIEDVVDAAIAAYDAPALEPRAFNITGGTRLSFEEIAAAVHAAVPEAQIVNEPGDDAGDLYHAPMDISAAERVLGWVPRWSLADGVKAYAAWLTEHPF